MTDGATKHYWENEKKNKKPVDKSIYYISLGIAVDGLIRMVMEEDNGNRAKSKD